MAWAHGALSGKVLPPPVSEDDLRKRVASFHWPSVFKPGDVIRSRDGAAIGVVLTVGNYAPDDDPRYELHVDGAVDGVRDGVGLWDPWEAAIANDPDSVAEVQRLGLR